MSVPNLRSFKVHQNSAVNVVEIIVKMIDDQNELKYCVKIQMNRYIADELNQPESSIGE